MNIADKETIAYASKKMTPKETFLLICVFIINACFPSRSITAGCRMEKVQVPFP
jgi:hypothetical protein